MTRPSPQNPDVFEDHVKNLLENNYDCDVIKAPKNQPNYDLEITRQGGTNLSEDGRSIAVQAKNFKRRVGITSVKKFIDSLTREYQTQMQFSEGLFISGNGFSKAAIDYVVRGESRKNTRTPVVSLGTANIDNIEQDFPDPRSSLSLKRDNPPVSPLADYQGKDQKKELAGLLSLASDIGEEQAVPADLTTKSRSDSNAYEENNIHKDKQKSRRYYFGIFTNKGGTGKTTVAAHLAGAFALMGYDVILLDIDPQRNLKKLFQNDEDDSSLYVPPLEPGQTGHGIFVLDDKEWENDKDNHNDVQIIICDCSPTFEENPGDLVKEFDYCVIPTTLNPLGIAKNSDVIKRTFEKIRTKNSKTQMHILINHYTEYKNKEKRNNLLLNLLKEQIDFSEDKKSYLIDPNACAIHRSDSLYYWGMHIVENKEPRLAFELHGGRSVPGEDFRKLAEYFHERFEESQMDATQVPMDATQVPTAWRRRLRINFGRRRRLLAQPGDFRA